MASAPPASPAAPAVPGESGAGVGPLLDGLRAARPLAEAAASRPSRRCSARLGRWRGLPSTPAKSALSRSPGLWDGARSSRRHGASRQLRVRVRVGRNQQFHRLLNTGSTTATVVDVDVMVAMGHLPGCAETRKAGPAKAPAANEDTTIRQRPRFTPGHRRDPHSVLCRRLCVLQFPAAVHAFLRRSSGYERSRRLRAVGRSWRGPRWLVIGVPQREARWDCRFWRGHGRPGLPVLR